MNKGQRKLAPPFHTTEPDFDSAFVSANECADPHEKKYSIQRLTSAFQLCSPVCVLAAVINGGKTQPYEKCAYLYFVAELCRLIEIIISRLF